MIYLTALGRPALLCAVIFFLSIVTLSANSATDIPVPPGLNPGDEYRLVFVTSGTRQPLSVNINHYNTFVQGFASAADLGTEWSAIASTGDVDARTNTASDPNVDGLGVPIYRVDGTRIAATNLDLWDGGIEAPINLDEHGDEIFTHYVWTGSHFNGSADRRLGNNGVPTVGVSSWTSAGWVEANFQNNTQYLPLYAMSGILVAPAPKSTEYNDKELFLCQTESTSATGPLPQTAQTTNPISVGPATFTADKLAIGESSTGPRDWSTILPGNEIAISEGFNGALNDSLQIEFATPVVAVGFDFVEPHASSASIDGCGGTCIDSTFTVTLFNGASIVNAFTFNAPNDVVAFVGYQSDLPFDRLEIIETTGGDENEFFGEIYSASTYPVIDKVYDNKESFLCLTGATSASGPLPQIAQRSSPIHSESTTFTANIIASGMSSSGPQDWSTLLAGNELVITEGYNDPLSDSLLVDFDSHVSAAGFEFVEPFASSGAIDGCNGVCIDSEFQVTLESNGVFVDGFTFNVDNDTAAFVGISSPNLFNRMIIEETTGGDENEFYGEFYSVAVDIPEKNIPIPMWGLTLLAAMLSFVGIQVTTRRLGG